LGERATWITQAIGLGRCHAEVLRQQRGPQPPVGELRSAFLGARGERSERRRIDELAQMRGDASDREHVEQRAR
jgi:hypothetical protein